MRVARQWGHPVSYAPLLAALLLVSVVPSSGAAQSEGAEWADIQGIAVGDHWKYRVSGQENGDIQNVVAAVERKTNGFDKNWETYRIDAEGTFQSKQRPSELAGTDIGTQGETEITIHVDVSKWVRRADYGVAHLEGKTNIESESDETTTTVTESYDPPLVEMVFPFAPGYEWRTGAYWYLKRGSEEPQDAKLDHRVEVLAIENVTVPAGTFMSWKLRITGGENPDDYKIQWYSEEVCDLVKEERYKNDDETTPINTQVLTSFHCSRTEKENPTYDTDWVILQETGGKFPPLPGFDKYDPNKETNTATGPGFGTLLLLTGSALAAVAAGFTVVRSRRD